MPLPIEHQAQTLPPSTSLVVALSGGLDSVVLLDALHRLHAAGALPRISILTAAHVHHGLSKNADQWLDFCTRFCDQRAIPFDHRRLQLASAPQTSLEETARQARHAALRAMAQAAGANTIALAHHQDDQVETLLLQLLRGAGPHGLAAMATYQPTTSDQGDARPALWRPLLDIPRSALLAYAQTHGLDWVEDESNCETRFKRNFLRHRILPVLEEGFPGYRKTLSRVATLQAEAIAMIDDDGHTVDQWQARFPMALPWFKTLPNATARQALRQALRHAGLRAPSFTHLREMTRQLQNARSDAQIELRHGTQRLGIHRDCIVLYRPVAAYRIAVDREENSSKTILLPQGLGLLRFAPMIGQGLSGDSLQRASEVLIASRLHEHEHLRLAANRPRRPLRDLLREAGIPHWARDTWPRLYIDGVLAAVPGIGVDAPWTAKEQQPGFSVQLEAES